MAVPTLRPSYLPPVSISRALSERLLFAWLLALNAMVAFDWLGAIAQRWRFSLPASAPTMFDAPLWGAHSLMAWVFAGLGSVVLAIVLVTRDNRRSASLLGWLLAMVSCAMLLGTLYELWQRRRHGVGFDGQFLFQHLLIYGGGLIAGLWTALDQLQPLRFNARLRALVIGASIVGIIVIGGPTLTEAWREYQPQHMPEFEVELVAASPVRETTANDDVVRTHNGAFRLDRTDRLRFNRGHVRRVRRLDHDEVSIRTCGCIAGALRARSRRLLGSHDAIFVNGELAAVARYDDYVLDGRIHLYGLEREQVAKLLEAMTSKR